MSSIINLNEHFLIQSLTEKNKELLTVNKLLFTKVASLKNRIKELETERDNNGNTMEFDGFEIINL